MASLIERLRQERDGLTGRERTIAAELESGYPHAGLQGATALAEKVGASAATVVRLATKLGYAGFPDLQRELRAEVEARLASPLQRLSQEPPEMLGEVSAGDIPQRTFEGAMSALTRSFGAFDRYTLDRIAGACVETKGRIFIIGEKKGRAIALYLHAQLNLCRENVLLFSTDAGFQADQLIDIGPDDAVIAIDVRRYVKRVVEASELAAERGAQLIVLSDSTQSPLFGATPLRLCAATSVVSAFETYVGLMLAADVITNLVIAAAPDAARRRLAAGEDAWRRLDVFSGEPSKLPPRG